MELLKMCIRTGYGEMLQSNGEASKETRYKTIHEHNPFPKKITEVFLFFNLCLSAYSKFCTLRLYYSCNN